jgi:hypothetical protein
MPSEDTGDGGASKPASTAGGSGVGSDGGFSCSCAMSYLNVGYEMICVRYYDRRGY